MNTPIYNMRPRRQSAIPNVIFALLIANGIVFALQQLNPRFMLINFALWPFGEPQSPFAPWQLITYGFLHGDMTHIFFNMFGLWMFGRELEQMMGSQRFLIYFLTCVAGAGAIQLIVAATQGGIYPTVGASGGVFGILLAYGLTFPNRTVMLIFPPIPMKAKYFVLFYGLLELYLGVSGNAPGVANFAHLGGMLFGFVLLRYWARPRRRG
ncbi:MAG: rhomboid family intramembrane serine protease [Gammaproteobacteria bacterium]|nr:rhomboid family intramembrane serine protease [Gammaproteobacteria bacterium]